MANEKKLIYADDARRAILEADPKLAYCIDKVKAVDAVEVVHGRWLGTHDGWYYSYSCSECGAEALTKEETMHDQVCSNYCPNCGAKMDGDGNENV